MAIRFVIKVEKHPKNSDSPLSVTDELERQRRVIRTYKRILYSLGGIVIGVTLIASGSFGYHHFFASHTTEQVSIVPLRIRKRVAFNVYYPAPKALPNGYSLDTNSFSATHQAVLYKVAYGNGQQLVFTIQQKPSNNDLQGFYAAHMPLTVPFQTSVGTAAIGAINNETVVSLPTNTNAWLIITAPFNINQNRLRQVLGSIKEA